MFQGRKRRRHHFSLASFLGLIITAVGIGILLFTIPFKFWIFIFGLGCVVIGIIIFQI